MSRLIVFLLMIAALLGGCGRKEATHEPEPPPEPLTGVLPINGPRAIYAGEPVEFRIGTVTDAKDGTNVSLLIMGPFGQQVVTGTFEGHAAIINVANETLIDAGQYAVAARSGAAYGEAWLHVLPGEPVSPSMLVVGPRSVQADGRDRGMAAVVPEDRYGNPTTQRPVELSALYPDNALITHKLLFSGLVAWEWIDPSRTAGTLRIGARVGSASSLEGSIELVAGEPIPFNLHASAETLHADGKQLAMLVTDPMIDRYGNGVADGTLVIFVVQDANGTERRIPAYTLDGVAQAPLQAPNQAGTMRVHAVSFGVRSNPLDIQVVEAVVEETFALSASVDSGTLRMTAGPITGIFGQLVPDGTSVRFAVTNVQGERQWLETVTVEGMATVELRLLALEVGRYTVEAFVGTAQASLNFSVP